MKAEMTIATLLLCVMTFLAVFFMFAMEEAEGAATESVYNDTNTYWADMSGNQKFTHTKDDYIVTAFCNDDGDLMIGYRRPSGAWDYSEVCAVDFLGNQASYWQVAGIINTDNNSLVVMAGMTISSYQRVYAFTKFAGSDWDEWDELLWLYQGSKSYYQGDMAINDTGKICGISRRSDNRLYYRIFDFEDYEMDGEDFGTFWDGVGSTVGLQIEANVTGSFWIMWRDTDNKWYVRDLENELSPQVIHPDPKYWAQTFAFLDNGVCVVAGAYDYSTSEWPEYYYQEVPETAFTAIRLDPIWVRDWVLQIQIVVRQGSTVPVILAYNNDDDVLYSYGAEWDASEETWQNSRHDTGISSATYYQPLGASNSLWPQHVSTGINWTRLASGWAITAKNTEENPDEWVLINDGMTWIADLTTEDPLITTESLPNGITGEGYSKLLEKTGGTSPYVWTIQTAPEWLEIDEDTGLLGGLCGDTGTYTVTVKFTEAAGRYDYATWTLEVTIAVSEPEPPGRFIDFPVSIDTLIGGIWWIFMFMAMFIAVMDVIMKARHKGSGGVI